MAKSSGRRRSSSAHSPQYAFLRLPRPHRHLPFRGGRAVRQANGCSSLARHHSHRRTSRRCSAARRRARRQRTLTLQRCSTVAPARMHAAQTWRAPPRAKVCVCAEGRQCETCDGIDVDGRGAGGRLQISASWQTSAPAAGRGANVDRKITRKTFAWWSGCNCEHRQASNLDCGAREQWMCTHGT